MLKVERLFCAPTQAILTVFCVDLVVVRWHVEQLKLDYYFDIENECLSAPIARCLLYLAFYEACTMMLQVARNRSLLLSIEALNILHKETKFIFRKGLAA